MFALLFAATFICQTSSLVGTWEGTLSWSTDGYMQEIHPIERLVISSELKVSGSYVITEVGALRHMGVFEGEISKDGKLAEVFFRYERLRAIGRLDGSVTLSKDGSKLASEGLNYRDLSSRNPTDHTNHRAKLELHRKPMGAIAPFFLTKLNLKDRPSGIDSTG